MNPYRFFERFAAEYPGRSNPIGMITAIQHNPKYDSDLLFSGFRRSGAGRILSYSNLFGLCFEVEHIERPGRAPAAGTTRYAWYRVEEILYLMDPSSWLTTSITVDFGPLDSVSIGPRLVSDEPIPSNLDEIIREL